MNHYASAALIIMYACTGQRHDSAALHHRAMEVESKKKERTGSRRFFFIESIFFPFAFRMVTRPKPTKRPAGRASGCAPHPAGH
ncbi:hypothetical protein ABEW24_25420 [Paenibacillus jamilae]|uniref:hypothetical protein n=1 Tax=Paenibacillus jamilae TaxID=114136 RepID=UPI003D274BB2